MVEFNVVLNNRNETAKRGQKLRSRLFVASLHCELKVFRKSFSMYSGRADAGAGIFKVFDDFFFFNY